MSDVTGEVTFAKDVVVNVDTGIDHLIIDGKRFPYHISLDHQVKVHTDIDGLAVVQVGIVVDRSVTVVDRSARA